MKRVSTVSLTIVGHNIQQSFSIEHAERLLSIQNSGWELSESSNFIFDSKHGLSIRNDKRNIKQSEK